MDRLGTIALLLLFLCLLLDSPAAAGAFRLEVEAGPAFQTRNDFAVPGDTGTRVALDNSTTAALRASLHWHFGRKWSMRWMAAPLRLTQNFAATEPVLFQDTLFAAGQEISTRYRFDSYRMSAYYRFAPRGNWSYRLGFTLKVRDAEIRLQGAEGTESKSNTGAVPLVYGGLRYEHRSGIALDVEADALGAPQGRAIDVLSRLEFPLTSGVRGYAGYRILDGGADNDEVYAFATVHYLVGGITLVF